MKDIDYSKFKKLRQDTQTVTLKHPDGHVLRIAVSGLSAGLRKKITDMPIHAAEGERIVAIPPAAAQSAPSVKRAPQAPTEQETDDSEGDDDTDDDDDTPESSPTAPAPAPAPAPAQPAPTTAVPQNQAAAATPAVQAPVSTLAPEIPSPPSPPSAADYNAQDADYARALLHKEIKPETYEQLYGKKDTLGKIGTIFGMLLSGAGSGLAHQPNALMEMMNKEIDRDLEAQKLKKTNAQTFLNATYQHELQNAQIKRLNYENAKTEAETGKLPSEGALLKAQAAAVPARAKLESSQANAIDAENAGLAAANRAKNHILASSYQSLATQNANNPQAQAVLQNVVAPAIEQQKQKNNAEAAAKVQLNTAKHAQSNGEAAPNTGVDIGSMQNKITLGKMDASMPGAIPPGDVPQVTKEANAVKLNRNFVKQYDDSFRKLDSMVAGGRVNKNVRDAEVESLANRVAKDSGVMSVDQARKMVNGMYPAWDDWGGARAEKYRKAMDHFKGMEADTATLERYGLKQPFPEFNYDQGAKTSITKSGGTPVERQLSNGKVGLFDPQTKKFIKYKGDTGSVATKGQ